LICQMAFPRLKELLGAYMLSAYIHVNPNQFLFIL